PGVARVDFVRHQNLLLDAGRTPVALLARNLASADPGSVVPLVAGGAPTRRDLPPVWISEAMVDLYGMRLGDQIALPLAGRSEHFVVAGIWRDYARQLGAVTMELEVYRRLSGDVTSRCGWHPVTRPPTWPPPCARASMRATGSRSPLRAKSAR
ncbi:MAG: lipoprotein exporter, fused inner rane subunit, partial [Proteobacteria bacterium]|nr:lipoprotein exporter, fused inner rane subunit [Pseudomonadota bacterium]